MFHRWPRQGQGSSWRRKALDCQGSQEYPSFVRKEGREKSKKQPGAEFRVGLFSFFTFPIHVNPAGTWNLLGICHLFLRFGEIVRFACAFGPKFYSQAKASHNTLTEYSSEPQPTSKIGKGSTLVPAVLAGMTQKISARKARKNKMMNVREKKTRR